ncbi:hypothetical protein GOV13_04305 [Candidatus Pacearchaeota archaeon]|nr:hypothetical protein [Candidatus Pacearchaeota archaeon]
MKKLVIFSFMLILLIVNVLGVAEIVLETITELKDGSKIEGYGIDHNEGVYTFAGEDNKLCLPNDCFENIKSQDKAGHPSYIETDEEGNIIKADFTTDENGGTYRLGEKTLELLPNTRIQYENGEYIIYRKEGKESGSFKFKNQQEDKFTQIDFYFDEKIDITGNRIFGKNFVIDGDLVKGINGGEGEVMISNGKINYIGEKTIATIKGVEHRTSEENLNFYSGGVNVYYDENFNPSQHRNENYFNYGRNSIHSGGEGFSSTLTEENEIFHELKFKKTIKGTPHEEIGSFVISPNDGYLEIKRNSNQKEFILDVNSEGDFEIENGRIIISSEGGEIFTSTNSDKDLSQDMILNDEYIIEGLSFKNKEGAINIDHRLPWERTIERIKNLDMAEANQLRESLFKEWNERPRNYMGFMNSVEEEDLVKWMYESADIANQNKYGVKVTPSEVFVVAMMEGLGDPHSGYIEMSYYDDHYAEINSFNHLGVDYAGDSTEMKRLKNGGFMPQNLNPVAVREAANEQGEIVKTGKFKDLKDGLTAVAGTLAHRKWRFETDFKRHFGEDEFNKLQDDEKFFWSYLYFNTGEGAGKGELTGNEYKIGLGRTEKGAGREALYKPRGEEESTYYQRNTVVNSIRRMVTNKWIRNLNIFGI